MSLPGPLVCVVGPTASGKSLVAEGVATRLGSSVVSVDAMQVYRGMDVGTAKTPVSERRCPLLMIDVADITDRGFWQEAEGRLYGTDSVVMMEGWMPAEREEELARVFDRYDCAWDSRDPEEDEIEFARRCAREASHRLGRQMKSGLKRK